MKANNIDPTVVRPAGASIGPGTTVGYATILIDNLEIEDEVQVEQGVIFAGGGTKKTKIRSHVHICAGAVIGPEIEIGWGARVMPGSVVLNSIPPNAIVQGNPAQIVGYSHGAAFTHPDEVEAVLANARGGDRRHAEVRPLGVRGAALHLMPRFSDLRGSLSVGEFGSNLPFTPQRYFIVFDIPSEELRGEHAHRTCHQFLVCLHGSCRALLDDGNVRREVVLDQPDVGLHMPAMIWGTQYRYTRDAVLLVLASHAYDAADYIRTYEEFRNEVVRRKNDPLP